MLVALIVAYPVVVHLSLLWGYPIAGVMFLAVILGAAGARAIGRGRRTGWLTLTGGAVLALVGVATQNRLAPLYIPPLLINLGLATLCGLSLMPNRTPLITAYAHRRRGCSEPRLDHYTRRVTQTWTLVFLLMAVESTLLALFASPEIWSLFTNFLNYALVGLIFVIEYQIRLRVLAHLPHDGFLQFLRGLAGPQGFRTNLKP